MAKIFTGVVVSDKMVRTVVVEVTSRKPHPIYRKLLKRSKRFKADTNGLEVRLNERVRIAETKPLSKDKYFVVKEVIRTKEEK